MMRFIVSVVATVAIFLAATAASATVSFTAVGEILTGANAGSADTTLAAAGDQVQVDIFAQNDSAIAGASFTAGIAGDFGVDGLQFDGGLTAATWFNSSLSKFGAPQGGALNGDGTSNGADGSYTSIAIPRSLSGADITLNGNIRFFSAFLISVTGDGSFDTGILDGSVGAGGTPNIGLTGNGAAHVRLVFTVIGSGAVLNIGNNAPDDSLTPDVGGVGGINPTSIQIGSLVAVPEPGTALLMGLGLSGLSFAGRRRA